MGAIGTERQNQYSQRLCQQNMSVINTDYMQKDVTCSGRALGLLEVNPKTCIVLENTRLKEQTWSNPYMQTPSYGHAYKCI